MACASKGPEDYLWAHVVVGNWRNIPAGIWNARRISRSIFRVPMHDYSTSVATTSVVVTSFAVLQDEVDHDEVLQDEVDHDEVL